MQAMPHFGGQVTAPPRHAIILFNRPVVVGFCSSTSWEPNEGIANNAVTKPMVPECAREMLYKPS
jgi:hypothetical protein